MNLFLRAVLCMSIALMAIPLIADEEVKEAEEKGDRFGVPDTIYAEVARVDEHTMSITISYFNDENVVGIAVPLKMSAGLNKIVADSAIYTGGRVNHWTYRGFRPDTAIQCVTLGMIANLGPTDHKLTPGSGRLVTVFVSSLEDKKIEKLVVDTTTTNPDNSLMVIVDTVQGEGDDTTHVDFFDRSLVPVWVVHEPEPAVPKAD